MGNGPSRNLHEAAASGDIQALREFVVRDGINSKDQEGWTALHFAAFRGKLEALNELLQLGADASIIDKEGRTALHLAAVNGKRGLVAALCAAHAYVDPRDKHGMTPLHKSATKGTTTAAEELLQRGASVNCALEDGMTALHLAAWKGHEATLQALLSHGADIAAVNMDGQTALHEAAAAGRHRIAEVLLAAGASALALDKEGRTPADLAAQQGHRQLAELIIAGGGARDARPAGGAGVPPQGTAPRAPAPSAPPLLRPEYAEHALPPTLQQAPDATAGGVHYPAVFGTKEAGVRAPPLDTAPLAPPARGEQAAKRQPRSDPAREAFERGLLNTAQRLFKAVNGMGGRPQGPPEDAEAARKAQQAAKRDHDIKDDWGTSGKRDWGGVPVDTPGQRQYNLEPFEPAQAKEEAYDSDDYEQAEEKAPRKTRVDAQRAVPHYIQQQTKAGVARRLVELEEEMNKQQGWVRGGDRETARLTKAQQAKLRQQEEEIAALKAQLESRLQLGSAAPQGRQQGFADAYRTYTQAEVDAATKGFARDHMLGRDADGIYFHGTLDSTPVALLVLNPEAQGGRDVGADAEVLGRLHHPHILPLLGACPRGGCLVYQLPTRGSVEDALRQSPPPGTRQPVRLTWQDRVRVASEVATALFFLHSAPDLSGSAQPILLYGRLQPAAITLDDTLTAKLSGVGLGGLLSGGMLPMRKAELMDGDLRPYADPQFLSSQRYTAASDVYALGVTMLQLLTGRQAAGLVSAMEWVVMEGRLSDVLDPPDWPQPEAMAFAKLALRCTEHRQYDRPDLGREVLPELSRMAGGGAGGGGGARTAQLLDSDVPEMFVCPITQEMMEDPVVCSDGYTYERAAVSQWIETGHTTSPMTNLPLASHTLIPNHAIRSAAHEWREAHRKAAHR